MRRFAVQLTAEQQAVAKAAAAERAATDKRRMEEQAARKEAQKKPRGDVDLPFDAKFLAIRLLNSTTKA